MPRTPIQSALIRDKRRKSILKKALILFATLGYQRITIDHIVSACNCSHGLFYHYFSSKDAIYDALLNETIERHPEWDPAVWQRKEGESVSSYLSFASKLLDGAESSAYLALLLTSVKEEGSVLKRLTKLIESEQSKGSLSIKESADVLASKITHFLLSSAIRKIQRLDSCDGEAAYQAVSSMLAA